jgi:hypothetical protein
MSYRVGIIGCGKARNRAGATGFGMSHAHALGYAILIFATYESSRRRGRIDLPLTIEDSPLLAMYESGDVAQSMVV